MQVTLRQYTIESDCLLNIAEYVYFPFKFVVFCFKVGIGGYVGRI